MLKLLFLNRDMEYHGGVSNVLLTLAVGQDRERTQMFFGSLMNPSDAMAQRFKEQGSELLCIGDSGYLRPAKALRKFIQQNQIDFVIASAFKASLVAKIACRGLKCGVVHYIHAVDLVLEGKLKRKLFSVMSRHDPMLFVSETVKQAHRPADHAGPAAVVYNGVRDPFSSDSTKPYPREVRREFGVADDALLLCYMGAFVGWKDHPTALGAFAKLDGSMSPRLLLIGKGEPGSTVEAQVKQMDDWRVQIVSPRPDARRVLGCVDVYIHTSRREGFGLAVVEAMLAGRPVVATREGAFMEYIEDGKTGLLAEPGDPASFASKIEMLAKDRELASRIAIAGREAALRRFSPAGCAESISKFLEGTRTDDRISAVAS